MNSVLEVLDKLNEILDKNTIVTDVCSLKEFVTKKDYNFEFIPSHPMAGTEFSGWENSFTEMFKGAKWVITPLENNSQEKIEILEELIKTTGAKIVKTTPQEHDRAVALISHAPLL